MSVDTAPSLVGLAALLTGVGSHTPWPVLSASGLGERTCIDAGAGVVLAVRAPGRRVLDLQVRTAVTECVEQWTGISAYPGGVATASSWRIWTTREGGPVLDADPSATVLRGAGRVWGLEYDADGSAISSSWQLHRSTPVSYALARAGFSLAWGVARQAFDALHGFAVSETSGPWSIARRFDGSPTVRIGTSRWAWSVDDRAKGVRLADWIASYGGDRAYASALHDLLTRDGAVRVGRAAEVDVHGDEVVGVSAYLVVPQTSTETQREGNQP
jgi:hypothetical protein